MDATKRKELIAKHAEQKRIQPSLETPIHDMNAYGFSDNYAIYNETAGVVAVEHNQSEAEALRDWLTNYHGINHFVRRNRIDQVREAKAYFPQPVLHPSREMAFQDTGLWPSKRKGA